MYQLMELPYAYDAFEPKLSYKTIYIHHEKLHRGYLDRLNRLLGDLGYHYRYTMVELLDHLDEFPVDKRDDIVYLVGGVINHDLYFTSMSPDKHTVPTGALKEQIDRQYGSYEAFQKEFMRKANLLVGSGYTFLVVNGNKELQIVNFSNQETPYSYQMTPILALDLWEHSYYLDDENRRTQYISDFFSIIDLQAIGKRYEQTTQKNK